MLFLLDTIWNNEKKTKQECDLSNILFFVLRAEDALDIDNVAYRPGGPNLRVQQKLHPPEKLPDLTKFSFTFSYNQ